MMTFAIRSSFEQSFEDFREESIALDRENILPKKHESFF